MQLHINKDFMRNRIDIYVYDIYNGRQRFYIPPEPGESTEAYRFVEIDQDEVISYNDRLKPFLTMPFNLANGFICLIAEYAKNEGISVKEQSNNAGKLAAIQQHNDFLQSNLQNVINHLIAPPVFQNFKSSE
jgi:hypothetical protein